MDKMPTKPQPITQEPRPAFEREYTRETKRVNIQEILSDKDTNVNVNVKRRKKRVKSFKEQFSEHVQRITDEMLAREPWKQTRKFVIIKKSKNKK